MAANTNNEQSCEHLYQRVVIKGNTTPHPAVLSEPETLPVPASNTETRQDWPESDSVLTPFGQKTVLVQKWRLPTLSEPNQRFHEVSAIVTFRHCGCADKCNTAVLELQVWRLYAAAHSSAASSSECCALLGKRKKKTLKGQMNSGRVPHLDCLHSVALLVEAQSWKSCVRLKRTHISLPVLSHAAAVTAESPPAGCCILRVTKKKEKLLLKRE